MRDDENILGKIITDIQLKSLQKFKYSIHSAYCYRATFQMQTLFDKCARF